MTNNTFNLSRFGKVLSTDIKSGFSKSWVTLLNLALIPVYGMFFTGFFRVLFGETWAGQPYTVRVVIFAFVILAVLIAVPIMLYGKLTDKAPGSSFTLVPASVLEKTLSMVLVSCVIAPAVFCGAYYLVDGLVCVIVPSSGAPLIDFSGLLNLGNSLSEESERFAALVNTVTNPALYIDDAIQVALCFLLGALMFKKGKFAKTVLVLMLIGIVSSSICTPIFAHTGMAAASAGSTEEALQLIESKLGWIFDNLALVDTISDTLVNVALCIAIFFRIKTIKH